MDFSEPLFVGTTPGLEPALSHELTSLGWRVRAEPGGVEAWGPKGAHQEANLRLRTASRVLLRLGTWSVDSPEALRERLTRLPWADLLRRTDPLSLQVSAPGRALADDVAWAFEEVHGSKVSQVGEEDSVQGPVFFVRLQEEAPRHGRKQSQDSLRCTVSIDTSGALLYRRGYRQEISRAPLRETLAAGLLLLAGYDGERPLCDPMCGSGTLLIEGAWLSQRRAPGLDREFAFQRWPSFDEGAWEARVLRARSEERHQGLPTLLGSDLHAGSLGTARRNAKRAHVLERLTLSRTDVAELTPPPDVPPGLVIANPPYGKRVGEEGDLVPLYRALGERLRGPFARWDAAVLVPERRFEVALGLETTRAFEVSNGGIRCRLLVRSRD